MDLKRSTREGEHYWGFTPAPAPHAARRLDESLEDQQGRRCRRLQVFRYLCKNPGVALAKHRGFVCIACRLIKHSDRLMLRARIEWG